MDKKIFKLLVVDDETTLNEFTTNLLKKAGFSVVPAYAYQDAKALLKEKTFDLIVLDWKLDKGRTGLDLLPFVGGFLQVTA